MRTTKASARMQDGYFIEKVHVLMASTLHKRQLTYSSCAKRKRKRNKVKRKIEVGKKCRMTQIKRSIEENTD